MNFIWKNRSFHTDEHLISVRDRALRGDGVFDTMLCVDGAPVYCNDHLDRLLRNAKVLGLSVTLNATELTSIIHDVIEKNEATVGRSCINTTITRGLASHGLITPDHQEPTIMIQVSPAPEAKAPLHAIIARSVHRNEGSPLSQMKTLNYGDNILARREAEDAGVDEALLLNNAENVACFTVGNIFVGKQGQLLTPPLSDGAMDGIIRRKWMECADVIEHSLNVDHLETADAIFMTNSLRGIVPVVSLGGKTFDSADFAFDPNIYLG